MRHASRATIAALEPLLDELRALDGLKEKTPGVFYWKSRAFLHFHEDGEAIFADVRLGGADFERRPCTSSREQAALLAAVRRWFRDTRAGGPGGGGRV